MNHPIVAVIGSNGLLGQHVARIFSAESDFTPALSDLHTTSVALPPGATYEPLDFTDRAAVKDFIMRVAPQVVVNCAALTDVDGCDREREHAWRINVRGVEHLVEACRKTDARLIHFSTDYVFDGKHGPYTERDVPNPINYYGKTKLASENVCRTGGIRFTIVRTMILFGVGEQVRENFVTWVLRNLQRGTPINVVTDQIGNPTLVDDLAFATLRIVERWREGIYNVAGMDIVSRYDFALAVAKVFGMDAELIHPIATSSLRQQAARPLASGLVTLKAQTELGIHLSNTIEGLQTMKLQIERAHKIK